MWGVNPLEGNSLVDGIFWDLRVGIFGLVNRGIDPPHRYLSHHRIDVKHCSLVVNYLDN